MEKWYHKSHRRNLIDMHIPDWNPEFFAEFDSEQYVKMLKTANVDTAYIYTTSCVGLCNFPTKIGKMHEGLKGRDVIREITDGCRKEGIRPILYMNIWSKWAYDTYPEWRSITPEGKQSLEFMFGQPGRYGVLCLNSPYQKYVLELTKELMENYQTDGLWVDMIVWKMVCACPHCRKRFTEETGHSFPETVNMADPIYLKFLKKREEWLSEFFDKIKSVVHSYNSDATVVCNSAYYPPMAAGMSLEFAQQTEFITGDADLGIERSFESKLFNNVTKNHPYEFLCSVMDPNLNEHSMLKTKDHLIQLMTSCIAHNGRNGFIDAIDPSGKLNPAVYTTMREVYDETDKYIPFLEPEMEMCADVAIYTNFSCYHTPDDNGKPLYDNRLMSEHQKSTYKMAEHLVAHNIPYDVITSLSIGSFDKYKALLLSDVFVLTNEEVNALRDYVKNGGNLYVSGRCGIYDGYGNMNECGALSDVIGVKFTGKTDEEITYIRPCENYGILENYTNDHPLSCHSWQVIVETADDAKILAYITFPIVPSKDITKFASAISNPPGNHTAYPSIVSYNHGKGKVIYSAAPIEKLSGRDHSSLFIKFITDLMGDEPCFKSNAQPPVEIVMYRQKESKNYVINITNSLLPVLTLPDIEISVKLKGRLKSIYSAPDKTPVAYERVGNYIKFKLDRLHTFKMIIAETEE